MPEQAVIRARSKSRSVVYCAAAIACMAVTAWVTVPIGPVPLSLAPLAVFFTLFALKPREAFIAICGYIILGGLGLPLFTGFRGGLGALLGPTGGFIIGDIVGAFCALSVGLLVTKRSLFDSDKVISLFGSKIARGFFYRNLVVGLVFLVVLYLFGWMWLMISGNLSAGAAFLAAVAPFILPDFLKMVLAIFLAQVVGAARRKL